MKQGLINFSDIENGSDECVVLSFPEKQLSNFNEFTNKKLSFDEDSISDLFEYKKKIEIQIQKKKKQKEVQKIITKKMGICNLILYLTQLQEKQSEIQECMRSQEIQLINGNLQVVYDFESKLNEAQFYSFVKKTHVFQVKISNGRLIQAQKIKICEIKSIQNTKGKRGRKRKIPLIQQIRALQNQSNKEETKIVKGDESKYVVKDDESKNVIKGDLLDELSANKRHKAYLTPRITAKYFPNLTCRPSTRRLSKPISQEYLMSKNKQNSNNSNNNNNKNKIMQPIKSEIDQKQEIHPQQQVESYCQQQQQQLQALQQDQQAQQQEHYQVEEYEKEPLQNTNKVIQIEQQDVLVSSPQFQQNHLEVQEFYHQPEICKISPPIQQEEEFLEQQQIFDFQNFANEFNQQQDLCDEDDDIPNDFYLNYDNGQDKYQNENLINDNEFIQNDIEQKQLQFDENIYFQNLEMIVPQNQELNNRKSSEQSKHLSSTGKSSKNNGAQKKKRGQATHKNNLKLFELGQQNDLELSDYVKLVQEYEDEESQHKQKEILEQQDMDRKSSKDQQNTQQQDEKNQSRVQVKQDKSSENNNNQKDISCDEQLDDQLKDTERPKEKQTQPFLEIQEIPLSCFEQSIKKSSQTNPESQSLLIQINDTNSENEFVLQLSFENNDEQNSIVALDKQTTKTINQQKNNQQKPKSYRKQQTKKSKKKKSTNKKRQKQVPKSTSKSRKPLSLPQKTPVTRKQKQNEKKEIVVITIDDSSDDESLKEDQRVTRNRKSKQKISIFEEWGEKKISKQSKLEKKQEMIIYKTKQEIREKLRKQEKRSK